MQIKQLPFQASILATAVALTACGGDSKSSSTPGLTGGAADAFTISASGGASASSEGGNGGSVDIYKQNSETALIINRAGAAAAVFVAPQTTVQLGSVVATISENTTVENITELPAGAAAGLLYTVPGNNRLYKYDGSEDIATRAQEVTGLEVAAGATLTLEANAGSTVRLYFSNDINNNGTIETAVAATEVDANSDRANLSLFPSAYHGSGSINTSGVYTGSEGSLSNGQGAGDIYIAANTIENSGTFSANGADYAGENGGEGGAAGYIGLNSAIFISNTGDISANTGGTAQGRPGGTSSIELYSSRVNNSGDITANQGSATRNYGASSVEIFASAELINSGNISANGSDIIVTEGFDNAGNQAGAGGYIELALTGGEGYGGYGGLVEAEIRQLINSGDLTANGGDNAAIEGNAGRGGSIEVYSYDSDSDGNPGNSASILSVSGNLSVNGGTATAAYDADAGEQGGDGGDGGNIYVYQEGVPGSVFPTRLSGYGEINTDGGNGIAAGRGGNTDIYTYTNDDESALPTGAVEVTTNVSANAGTSSAAAEGQTAATGQRSHGATGGNLEIWINSDRPYLQQGLLNITYKGNFTANGSDSINASTTNNSTGRYFDVWAPDNITVVGNISQNGGSDTEASDDDNTYNVGADGGTTWISSQYGSVSFKGDVSANGGNGIIRGGYAGSMTTTAKLANKVAGTMSFNGGNALASTDDNDETFGGDGGSLVALSSRFTAKSAAVVSATGGTGDTAGYEGGVFVNADCQQGICRADFND